MRPQALAQQPLNRGLTPSLPGEDPGPCTLPDCPRECGGGGAPAPTEAEGVPTGPEGSLAVWAGPGSPKQLQANPAQVKAFTCWSSSLVPRSTLEAIRTVCLGCWSGCLSVLEQN